MIIYLRLHFRQFNGTARIEDANTNELLFSNILRQIEPRRIQCRSPHFFFGINDSKNVKKLPSIYLKIHSGSVRRNFRAVPYSRIESQW